MNRVHDRRRKHGLEGDVCLRPDPGQQTRLENWIEFQNYHLELHELEERATKDKREKLDAARKRLESSGLEELKDNGRLGGESEVW